MNYLKQVRILAVIFILLLAGCREDTPSEAVSVEGETAVSNENTSEATEEGQPVAPLPTRNPNFVLVATDAPLPPYAQFDPFGNVEGFNNDIMAELAAIGNFDYEFVVTPHQGVLDILATGHSQDFDAVMSILLIPETPQEGIVYTTPYLEIGQVMLVLADEKEITSYRDLQPGMAIGVQGGTAGEQTSRELLGIGDDDLYNGYEDPNQAIQALIDESVSAIIIDSYSANHFANAFPQQLKIAGGDGQEAWISSRAFGIAVAASNPDLLNNLNSAIDQLQADETVTQTALNWLVFENSTISNVDPGESRVGTPTNEFFIGVVGQLVDMDPASLTEDLIKWEVQSNTMSGLYMFNVDNELVPILAEGPPVISADKLEYTIQLKQGLQFPDGRDFTAEDVKWSVNRATRLGHRLVNRFLQDANEDNFADVEAVQVIDPFTVKFILKEPTSYFPSLLATPPYFPISSGCFTETADPGSTCGGIGPYTITSWTINDRMRLKMNPQWPGETPPASENIVIRFYETAADMRKSLVEFASIDLAWSGIPYSDVDELQAQDIDGDGNADFLPWEGSAIFKSYFVFNQGQPPWDNKKVRQAVAYALDRDALVNEVFGGSRTPLLSPIPNDVPGHINILPARDPEKVRSLMLEVGYTPEKPLEITIWFVNDGRYSPVEEAYINAIRSQLESTGVFRVALAGAAWGEFVGQISECKYPAYLLGWPSPGRPTLSLDASSWTDFFTAGSDSDEDCPNYANYTSPEMTRLVAASRAEVDPAARQELLAQIQTLWANELPTLDITQEPRHGLSLAGVGNVAVDALGMLHYELLTKN